MKEQRSSRDQYGTVWQIMKIIKDEHKQKSNATTSARTLNFVRKHNNVKQRLAN